MTEKKIGNVTHYYNHLHVATVQLTDGELRVGDMIRIEGHTSDFTQKIGSMELDHEKVDVAKPGDMIFMCSYGSGAGSDAFIWKVTDRIDEVRDLAVRTHKLLDENQIYIDYGTYAKYRHKIRKNA